LAVVVATFLSNYLLGSIIFDHIVLRFGRIHSG
jgi:glycerol-3-phosphate acyltransferase PlsY